MTGAVLAVVSDWISDAGSEAPGSSGASLCRAPSLWRCWREIDRVGASNRGLMSLDAPRPPKPQDRSATALPGRMCRFNEEQRNHRALHNEMGRSRGRQRHRSLRDDRHACWCCVVSYPWDRGCPAIRVEPPDFGVEPSRVEPIDVKRFGSANGNRTRIFRLLVFPVSY
jgi:hypothetical protein